VLVTEKNLNQIVDRFCKPGQKSFDTETTGLLPYQGDRMFSAILADDIGPVYFNFQDYGDDTFFFEDERVMREIFAQKHSYWFAHNAKFDLAMMKFASIDVAGPVHCTQAIGRVISNDKLSYSLDNLAKERGLAKDNAVEDYITKHGLSKSIQVPGQKKKSKIKFYDKVPFPIMYNYGLKDGTITRALGLHQIADIENVAATTAIGKNSVKDVYLTELDITKICFNMEWDGALTDPKYTTTAFDAEVDNLKIAQNRMEAMIGLPFKDGSKFLTQAFDKLEIPLVRNAPTKAAKKKALEKGVPAIGNAVFNESVLKNIDGEFPQLLKIWRKAEKKAGTYYTAFKHFRDDNDVIHCDFRQAGTVTGRMSCATPNLQNVPKRGEDKSVYPVRKVFIPEPEFCLVMIDYDQMEYRLMLEYAREFELIAKVLAGMCVHTATAELVKVTRDVAKTINFLFIFGGGVNAVMKQLGLTYEQAVELKTKYFSTLPAVKKLMRDVSRVSAQRGFVVNWAGRRCQLSDVNFAYKMPNALIQGGCADVVKKAMVQTDKVTKGLQSKLILQVHDELIFQVHRDEFHIIPDLKFEMENVYKYKYLPLTVGVDHSWVSWHDKVEGLPSNELFEKTAGNNSQGESTGRPGHSKILLA